MRGVMAKLTKDELAKILTERLKLIEPEFHLEKVGPRIIGNIISPTFKGKRDHQRQKMIWDALQEEFGADSVLKIGMLLAYTPEEWRLGAITQTDTKKVKKAG